jgi:hypothetical protein
LQVVLYSSKPLFYTSNVNYTGTSQDCASFSSGNSACSVAPTPAEAQFPGPVSVLTSGTTLNVTGTLVVTGNLQLQGATVVVAPGGALVVTGQLIIGSGSSVNLTGVTQSSSSVIVQAGSVVGQFAEFSAVPSSACVDATVTPVYTSTTVTALVSVSNACPGPSSPQLDSGAIAGIVIGAIVGGIVIAFLVLLVTRALMRKRNQHMLDRLRESNLDTLQREVNQVSGAQKKAELDLESLHDNVARVSTNHMHQMIAEKEIALRLK